MMSMKTVSVAKATNTTAKSSVTPGNEVFQTKAGKCSPSAGMLGNVVRLCEVSLMLISPGTCDVNRRKEAI